MLSALMESPSPPVSQPDDLTLVRLFISGNACFVANRHIQIQPANDTYQLLTRRGGLLAIARPSLSPPRVLIRQDTPYTSLLSYILLEYEYIPLGCNPDSNLCEYEKYPVPDGYQLRYTRAQELWKNWWMRRRQFARQPLQTDLLILTNHECYPIREMAITRSTLFIKTYLGETAHQVSDFIIWLEKVNEDEPKTQLLSPLTAPKPETKAEPQPSPATHITSPPMVEAPAVPKPIPPLLPTLHTAHQGLVQVVPGGVIIQTAMGQVIVMGSDLKVQWANHSESASAPPPSQSAS